MENPEICGLCLKARSTYIISETCYHKLCKLCLSNSVMDKITFFGIPFPCPVSNCRTSFPLTFLEKALLQKKEV